MSRSKRTLRTWVAVELMLEEPTLQEAMLQQAF
jgi:hypothetical protein